MPNRNDGLQVAAGVEVANHPKLPGRERFLEGIVDEVRDRLVRDVLVAEGVQPQF